MSGSPYTLPAPTPYGINQLSLTGDLSIITWVGSDGGRHYLSGPQAQANPRHGVKLLKIKGIDGPFKHLDQQAARQDGVDWLAAYYDPVQIDATIKVMGVTNADRRRVYRSWLNGWSPYSLGKLSWTTADFGTWWMPLRQYGSMTSDIPGGHLATWELEWTARCDTAFWQSFPSQSKVIATSATTLADPKDVQPNNFLPLFNRGGVPAWPEYLLQGPGTFTLGDNGSLTSARKISIQVNAGEVVLLKTLPRRRSAVEVNSNANVYPRLTGRFSQPVAPMSIGNPASGAVQVPITVTGAVPGTTAATATLTPLRVWPE